MSTASGNNTQRRIGTAGRSKSTVSLFQIQFNSQKTLKTPQNKSYGIPSKTIEEWNSKLKQKETTGVPIFLGTDGTVYDINYVQVFKHKLQEKSTLILNGTNTPNASSTNYYANGTNSNNTSPKLDSNNTTGTEEEENLEDETFQEQLYHLYNSIPQIDDYENYFDYEQNFLGWKLAVETMFLECRLPELTGRALYRPKHVDFQSKIRENSTFQDFSRPSVSSFSNEGDSDEKSDPMTSEVEEEGNVNGFEPSLSLKDLENNSDPWDCLMVPQEPQPVDYDTFEEYDEALCRWASICSTQLSIFPPHATQLRDLIPIQSISESQLSNVDQDESGKLQENGNQSSVPNVLIKSGIYEYEFLDNLIPQQYKFIHKLKEEQKFTLIEKDKLQPVGDPTRKALSLIFQSIEAKRQTNMAQHKSYLPPMIAKLHGTLPLPLIFGGQNQKSNAMPFKNDALRRTDLSPKQISDSYDCPVKISNVPINFKVPDHDIAFKFGLLYSDPGYPSIMMNQIKTFHTSDRHDHLYSWYHPLVNEEHQHHKEEIDFIILNQHTRTKDKLTIQNISDILYGDMYLDKFSDLLDASFSEDFDGGKSYATVITKCVTPDNVHQLLDLLVCSKSPLFQAKMSHLVMNFFSGNKGSLILESLIQNKDVKYLSLLTHSFDYISEVPMELFPWSDETYTLVKQVLGDSNETLWKLVFCNYYLSVIGRVLDIHVHLYYSKPVITQSKVSLTHSIATLLQNNTPSILDKIFTGIRHRSITVSSFCLFILLQLMHNQEGLAVSNCLKNDGIFLLDRIKRVCDSKLKHVQFAARRLFSVLGKAPWVDFVYKEFNKDPDATVKDIVGSEEKKPSNLQLELTLDLFIQSLDKALEAAIASLPITNSAIQNGSGSSGSGSSGSLSTTPPLSPVGSPPVSSPGNNQPTITIGIKSKFSFVLDNCLFHNLLQFFSKHSKESTYQMYTITSLLSRLANTHCTLGTILASQDVKSSQKRWGQACLSMSPSDVRLIISKMTDPSPASSPYTPQIKKNLLSMLRHVFKFYPVFEFIKKEDDFYSRLQSFCKDGNNTEFNREAWCLLYQICKNHIGTLDSLSRDKNLAGFFELVGTSSPPTVITNGLHYITKLFNISVSTPVGSDAKLSQKNKSDNKIIEKDVKSLNQLFIDKILFIKIHMIYRRYTTPPPQLGLGFIELAKFYNTLYTHPNCHKLQKDTFKKPEYKEGLSKIANMFIDSTVEQNLSEQSKPKESSGIFSFNTGNKDSKSDKDNSAPNSPSANSLTKESKESSSNKSVLGFKGFFSKSSSPTINSQK